jgi:hypothetical protein
VKHRHGSKGPWHKYSSKGLRSAKCGRNCATRPVLADPFVHSDSDASRRKSQTGPPAQVYYGRAWTTVWSAAGAPVQSARRRARKRLCCTGLTLQAHMDNGKPEPGGPDSAFAESNLDERERDRAVTTAATSYCPVRERQSHEPGRRQMSAAGRQHFGKRVSHSESGGVVHRGACCARPGGAHAQPILRRARQRGMPIRQLTPTHT